MAFVGFRLHGQRVRVRAPATGKLRKAEDAEEAEKKTPNGGTARRRLGQRPERARARGQFSLKVTMMGATTSTAWPFRMVGA